MSSNRPPLTADEFDSLHNRVNRPIPKGAGPDYLLSRAQEKLDGAASLLEDAQYFRERAIKRMRTYDIFLVTLIICIAANLTCAIFNFRAKREYERKLGEIRSGSAASAPADNPREGGDIVRPVEPEPSGVTPTPPPGRSVLGA